MRGRNFLHFIKFVFFIDKPHTQVTPKELEKLVFYAANKKLLVEIGVFEGATTVELAKNMNINGITYGIDPFFPGIFFIRWSKLITILNLRRNKVRKKTILIQKLSSEAINLVPDNLDFIFIDGDHSYEGFKKDWETWSQKLKSGGIICLHDTNIHPAAPTSIPGSIIYFKENILNNPNFKVLDSVDSLNILERI